MDSAAIRLPLISRSTFFWKQWQQADGQMENYTNKHSQASLHWRKWERRCWSWMGITSNKEKWAEDWLDYDRLVISLSHVPLTPGLEFCLCCLLWERDLKAQKRVCFVLLAYLKGECSLKISTSSLVWCWVTGNGDSGGIFQSYLVSTWLNLILVDLNPTLLRFQFELGTSRWPQNHKIRVGWVHDELINLKFMKFMCTSNMSTLKRGEFIISMETMEVVHITISHNLVLLALAADFSTLASVRSVLYRLLPNTTFFLRSDLSTKLYKLWKCFS